MKKQLLTVALIATIALTGCGQTKKVKTPMKESASVAETISGTYHIKTPSGEAKNTTYTFDKDKLTIEENGSYSMTKGKIKIAYGTNEEKEYSIKKVKDTYDLINKTNLIPLKYKDGTDGLAGKDNFKGTYNITGGQTFNFKTDGTVSVVTSHDCKVKKDTVTFANGSYDWKSTKDGIKLSTNGTYVMTLIP